MRSAKRIAELKSDGLHCTRCLKPFNEGHEPRFKQCDVCRQKKMDKRVRKARKPGMPIAFRQQEYRERHLARGLCERCPRPRMAKKNGKLYRYCELHQQKKRQLDAKRQPSIIDALVEKTYLRLRAGLCRHCGKTTPLNAKGKHWTECEECRARIYDSKEAFFQVVVAAGHL